MAVTSSVNFDFDPTSVPCKTGHHINGRTIELPGKKIEVNRPSDGQLMGCITDGDEAAVQMAVDSAKNGLKSSAWSKIAPRARAKVLRQWADLIDQEALSIAQLESAGSTRLIAETIERDVPRTADVIRFYAEYCDKLEGDITATEGSVLSLIRNEPYGIVGSIVPWNFPLITAVWKFAPALAAGNAIVLKPSELTPFSMMALAELSVRAGLPAGLLNIVNGFGPTTGAAIVRHRQIAKISFTGSSITGAQVMADAALNGVKPVTLELGGKSPQLVFNDPPDLGAVAGYVARGFLTNAGQVCTTGSRLIVHRSRADELVDRVIQLCGSMQAGPTWSSSTTLSPIVSAKQAERLDQLVRATIKEGATARIGGGPIESSNSGSYYAPTILEGVSSDMTGFREEFFGPVLSVHRFDDDEEGIAMAAHPVYGLAASVHTSDLRRAMRAADQLDAGMVWVNQHGRSPEFTFPAGGFKSSGFGKDLGRAGIEGYLRQKAIWVNYG